MNFRTVSNLPIVSSLVLSTWIRAGLVLVFIVLLSCSFRIQLVGAGEPEIRDGVLHVLNGDIPDNGRQSLELEELWRVGAGDEDVLFGVIVRALVGDDGNIYLLDQQLSEVQVFSPEGVHLRTLGGPGEGPGEANNPSDLVFMPDGCLGLIQMFPGKIVALRRDGTPAGVLRPAVSAGQGGGFLALVTGRSSGGTLALGGVQVSIDPTSGDQRRNFFLRSYDWTGEIKASICSEARDWKLDKAFAYREIENDFVWWRTDVAPDGKIVVCEPRYGYAVSVYRSDGTLERVIEREYESYPRSEKVFERWRAIYEGQRNAQLPAGTAVEVEKTEADIVSLRVAPDGSIWVLPSRQMYEPEPGSFAVYDVFTPGGTFDRQISIKCPGDASEDYLLFGADDLVIRVAGFWEGVLGANGAGGTAEGGIDPEPVEVICYRIK